jgi:glycosyltransferase involved in cell wall biosynthesis
VRCLDLKALPQPPSGKSGWPWTEESPQLPDKMPHGEPWPKMSIVTPSFNQGQYLEETIRSVLLQGYPDLEYIIIDGGSTDNSVEILKKYSQWLSFWVSEPDHGQSHAINKGFRKATGTILSYINSDDLYEPGAFTEIATAFRENPQLDLVAGVCTIFNAQGTTRVFQPHWPDDLSQYVRTTFSSTFGQPASFWTKDIYQRVDGFDESLSFCFDREFFLKIGLNGGKSKMFLKDIARFREHALSKSLSQSVRFYEESIVILERYGARCGVSAHERQRCKRVMLNDISYESVFIIWKTKGRMAALRRLFFGIFTSPNLLFQRKILGQMRRLLFFQADNVVELQR